MKRRVLWACAVGALAASGPVWAIPDTIFAPIVQADSPLNGQDLTDPLLAVLAGGGELPGEWVAEGRVGAAGISHLLARPELFGREVVILRAVHRDGALERLEATFADAGSYFGYFDEDVPEGLTKRQTHEWMDSRMQEKQTEFTTLYAEALETVRNGVSNKADRSKAKEVRFGKARTLRAETEQWVKDDVVIRLMAADDRLIRLVMARDEHMPDGWVDEAFEKETDRERSARLAESVVRRADGVVSITGLQPMPQGYKPYCGLNTLAMAARHLGLHLDEDWMAAAAGFQNTGSAAGSNMLRLYHAVASEAGMGMNRSNDFDESAVQSALWAGRPVVVWRRFSYDRNRLHDEVAAGNRKLPDPSGADEQASWPDESAPLHASLLTGYDPNKLEVFFLETWSGKDKPRRMSFDEMAATAYLTFVFTE